METISFLSKGVRYDAWQLVDFLTRRLSTVSANR